MNIIITQRHSLNKYGDQIDSLENSYVRYFEALGLNLFLLSNVTKKLERFLESIVPSGIILSGGGDVSPALYCGRVGDEAMSDERDMIESELLEMAVTKRIPVLGICRGMQFINVFFKGGLVRDIVKISGEENHEPPCTHKIAITDERLKALMGDENEITTNSYHRQGILQEGLGKGIRAFAVHNRLELIEGICHEEYPIAGVQWHPERPRSSYQLDKILVESFIHKKLFWEIKN
ncbi:MAG: hypothetical protein B6D35_10630 [Candidatus Brocadia sp. UTAMX2]|jgi:putative glutamine amidotransferase|nr:MAG: hypothetical protein B6D35_10630 [Candidatus Brocadia sp. UTAMX2]